MAYPPFAYMEPAIAQGESGGDWNALYNFQNRAGGLFGDVNVSDMTINEVLDFQRTGSPYATYVTDILGYKSTPVGRYQIVGDTLEWAKAKLGLTGEEKFDPATQRQIAEYIYNTQGPSAWEALKGTQMADQVTPQQMAPQQAAGYQPFSTENLPRNQRILLGISALQDAAASLRGKQTSFFSEALGGLEQQHRYGQELAFRQAQEQRLIDENRQQRELTAMTEIRRLMAERQKALDYGYPTDAIDAQIAAYQSSLTAMGSAFGQPAPAAQPAAQPAAGGVEPAAGGVEPAPQPPNLRTVSEAIYNPETSDADLDAAIQFLAPRATDPNVKAVLDAAVAERDKRTEAAAAAEEKAGVEETKVLKLTPRVGSALDFLSQENVAQRITDELYLERMGKIPSAAFMEYRNNLLTIRAIQGMKSVEEAKASGWTGSMTDNDIKIIMSTQGTLDEADPVGTLQTLNEIRMKLEAEGAEFKAPTVDDLLKLYKVD